MRERQWNLSKRWCSRLFWAFRITNRVHIKLIWPQDAFKLFSVWLSSRSCFSTHPVSMFSQFTWTKFTQTLTCSPNTAVSLLFVHVSLFFCVPSTSLSSAGKTFTASLFSLIAFCAPLCCHEKLIDYHLVFLHFLFMGMLCSLHKHL